MTERWMRSPRGPFFGVATGLAEWRDLPPTLTRIVVFALIFVTGVFPGLLIYLLLALILPQQKEGDYREKKHSSRFDHIYRTADDVEYEESGKSEEELRAEYEELKKKVEAMEKELFDRGGK